MTGKAGHIVLQHHPEGLGTKVDGSGEVAVVGRKPWPHYRRYQGILELPGDAFRHGIAQIGVGARRQVGTVLFNGSNGQNDGGLAVLDGSLDLVQLISSIRTVSLWTVFFG